jgi:soluble lytic murein transglycosylase
LKNIFFIWLFIPILAALAFPAPAAAAPSLFAPQARDRAPEKKPAPAPPDQAGADRTGVAPAAAAAKQSSPAIPAASEELRSIQRPPTVLGSGDGSASIVVDAQGNKTLVIRGDDPPQVLDDRLGGQTQIVLGDDTAGIVVDERGHKTLVVRDRDLLLPQAPPKAKNEEAPGNEGLSLPAGEKPYWVVEPPKPEQPYFMVAREEPAAPYWQVEATPETEPYWTVKEAEPERAYWLPPVERLEILASEVEPGVAPAPVRTASLAPSENIDHSISYYVYRDEAGVTHLTNMPTDPRYRLFTTVVKIQRGLSGGRGRFTHESLRPIIMRAAALYNLDPALIAAVIRSESAFDAQAVSWAGAQGLMQLMPATSREMGVLNPFDPEDNIMGGSRYLRLMLNRFGGDLTLAVAAYNCGPERVSRLWRVPNIAETQNYVKIVTSNYERYKLQF